MDKNSTEAPVILSNISAPLGNGENYWAFKKESRAKFSEILNNYKEVGEEYENLIKTIIEMKEQNKTDEEIAKVVDEGRQRIIDKIPENEQSIKLFESMEEKANQLENQGRIDVDKFREEVKEFIDQYQGHYKKENKEFINYILATNEKEDQLLRKIKDENTRERVIKSTQKKVQQNIETNKKVDYDDIMHDLDEHIDKIEEVQLTHVEDSSIVLASPYALRPNQQFSFSFEDILTTRRADVDFFEFVSVDRDFPESYQTENNEGYIAVTPDIISGIAPMNEGIFNYKTQIKYTSFRDGGEARIIETDFKLYVGEKYNQGPPKAISYAFYGAIFLGIITFIVILLLILKKIFSRKVIRFEEFEEGHYEPKEVPHAGSDLENTASDSQE